VYEVFKIVCNEKWSKAGDPHFRNSFGKRQLNIPLYGFHTLIEFSIIVIWPEVS